MPRDRWSGERERRNEHIKEGLLEQGRSWGTNTASISETEVPTPMTTLMPGGLDDVRREPEPEPQPPMPPEPQPPTPPQPVPQPEPSPPPPSGGSTPG